MSKSKGVMLLCGFFTLVGLVSLSAASNPQEIPIGESTCPEGWDKIHRGCYKFLTDGKTWQEAFDVCQRENGELTSVQSMREKEELQSHLLSRYSSFRKWWVGFQREGTRGDDWKWISNNRVDPSVTPWNNPRISRRPGNMCGMIDMSRSKLEISVTQCTKSQPYICEFHQITARPTEGSDSSVYQPKPEPFTPPAVDPTNQPKAKRSTPSSVEPAESVVSHTSKDCSCEQSGFSEDLLKRNIGQTVSSQLYEQYLQSEIKANNAKVAYYKEVSELYENALKAQTDYYNSYQAKLDLEVDQMRNNQKCP